MWMSHLWPSLPTGYSLQVLSFLLLVGIFSSVVSVTLMHWKRKYRHSRRRSRFCLTATVSDGLQIMSKKIASASAVEEVM